MMRPIDADEAIQRFDNDVETMKTNIEGKVPFQVGTAMVSAAKGIRTSLKETLDGTPTLDYEPVKHGEWRQHKLSVPKGRGQTYIVYGCSLCHKHERKRSDYCPNCGAKMDGGK